MVRLLVFGLAQGADTRYLEPYCSSPVLQCWEPDCYPQFYSVLMLLQCHWYVVGLTENDGHEIDGPRVQA